MSTIALGLLLTLVPARVNAVPPGYRLPFGGRHEITNGPACVPGHGEWPRSHEAIDFGLTFEPVLAAARGKVVRRWDDAANRDPNKGPAYGFGRLLVLHHDDGNYTYYAHLDSFTVELGQTVEAGQQIARSGASGMADGPHLHFEVRPAGNDSWELPGSPSTSIRDLPGITWYSGNSANTCNFGQYGHAIGGGRYADGFAVPPPDNTSSTDRARRDAITGYYRELLGRDPDAAGLDGWDRNGGSLDQIRQGILGSDEYARVQSIRAYYLLYLGRPADATGLRDWDLSGQPLESIRAGFVYSPERRDAIRKLYQRHLGRDPLTSGDEEGLNYWVATGLYLKAVEERIVGSPEYAQKHASPPATPSPAPTPPAAPDFYGAFIELLDVPRELHAGETANAIVKVSNTSRSTWPASVFASYHWKDTAENAVRWDNPRSDLGNARSPGGAIQFFMPIKAPDSAGTFVLEIDIVYEYVSWFSAQKVTTPRATVTVVPPAPVAKPTRPYITLDSSTIPQGGTSSGDITVTWTIHPGTCNTIAFSQKWDAIADTYPGQFSGSDYHGSSHFSDMGQSWPSGPHTLYVKWRCWTEDRNFPGDADILAMGPFTAGAPRPASLRVVTASIGPASLAQGPRSTFVSSCTTMATPRRRPADRLPARASQRPSIVRTTPAAPGTSVWTTTATRIRTASGTIDGAGALALRSPEVRTAWLRATSCSHWSRRERISSGSSRTAWRGLRGAIHRRPPL